MGSGFPFGAQLRCYEAYFTFLRLLTWILLRIPVFPKLKLGGGKSVSWFVNVQAIKIPNSVRYWTLDPRLASRLTLSVWNSPFENTQWRKVNQVQQGSRLTLSVLNSLLFLLLHDENWDLGNLMKHICGSAYESQAIKLHACKYSSESWLCWCWR